MKKIKTYLLVFFAGVIIGAVPVLIVFNLPEKIKTGKVKTTQISGAPVTHKDWNFKGDSIRFHSTAEGKGESVTEIPKGLIPEVNAWTSRTTVFQFDISMDYDFTLKDFIPTVGFSFGKRWGSFAIGAGPQVSAMVFSRSGIRSIGVHGWAQYWW